MWIKSVIMSMTMKRTGHLIEEYNGIQRGKEKRWKAWNFRYTGKSSRTKARTGEITTFTFPVLRTPVFMPVGTKATVKTLSPNEITELKAGIILSNTYHLMLRAWCWYCFLKQVDFINLCNILVVFLQIVVDFQVFSLSKLNKIDDDGVTFREHIGGQYIRMTPEKFYWYSE